MSILLKKEAIREASAVLGVRYVPPSPPTTTLANAFRGRRWWLGGSRGRSPRGTTVTSIRGVGFIQYPSARAFRRRKRRSSPAVRVLRTERGALVCGGVPAGDPGDPEGRGAKALGMISRRKHAIKVRTRLCRRFSNVNMPSWASGDNSPCDPGHERGEVASKFGRHANAGGAMQRSPVLCIADSVGAKPPDASPLGNEVLKVSSAPTGIVGRRSCDEHDSRFGPSQESSRSVLTFISAASTTFTAFVPTAVTSDQRDFFEGEQTRQGNSSSNSSLATDNGEAQERDDAEHCGANSRSAEEMPPPEPVKGTEARRQEPRAARRPTNPANSGRRPQRNGYARDTGVCGQGTKARGARTTTVSEPLAHRRCPTHAAPRAGGGKALAMQSLKIQASRPRSPLMLRTCTGDVVAQLKRA